MDWQSRIAIDPNILVGKPIIKGTRLAVEFIIDLLAQGWTTDKILRNYPGIVLSTSKMRERKGWVGKRVSQRDKLLVKILLGNSDANIPFESLCQLLCSLGFDERVRGSHHIFSKEGVQEILNLQSKQGKAKVYQVKQVRNVILNYHLGGQDEDSV